MSESNVFDPSQNYTSLADLAGVGFEDTSEYRHTTFPRGSFVWEIKEAQFTTTGSDQDKKPCIEFELVCVEVKSIIEANYHDDPTGRSIFQRFFLDKDVEKGLGGAKAFLVDIGFSGGAGRWDEILQASKGTRFVGEIKHAKNKNDPDRPFANLNTDKGKLRPAA